MESASANGARLRWQRRGKTTKRSFLSFIPGQKFSYMKDVDKINVLKAADFDFYLPKGLIAKKPSDKRDLSRLLVLHKNGKIEHRIFGNLPDYLNEGDLLLLNNTKVFPARLTGAKPTGGSFEFLLVTPVRNPFLSGINPAAEQRGIISNGVKEITWEILSKGKYRGEISIAEGFSADIENGTARFSYSGDF